MISPVLQTWLSDEKNRQCTFESRYLRLNLVSITYRTCLRAFNCRVWFFWSSDFLASIYSSMHVNFSARTSPFVMVGLCLPFLWVFCLNVQSFLCIIIPSAPTVCSNFSLGCFLPNFCSSLYLHLTRWKRDHQHFNHDPWLWNKLRHFLFFRWMR